MFYCCLKRELDGAGQAPARAGTGQTRPGGDGQALAPIHSDPAFELCGQTDLPVATDAQGRVAVIIGRATFDGRPAGQGGGADDLPAAVLESYCRAGEACLERLGGAFSVLIWDAPRRRLLAAMDRAGVCRIFWTEDDDGSVWISDCAGLISQHARNRARLSPQGVYNYLFYYAVPAPVSIYDGVRKLRPGEAIDVGGGGLSRRFYWSMPYQEHTDRPSAELRAELRDTLERSVARAIDDGEAAGTGNFLSGGLDSSTITGMVATRNPNAKSFTIRFEEAAYDEGEFARIAAEHFGTDHHERIVRPADVVDVVEKVAAFYDEPYGNTSAIAAYFCALAAREAGVHTMIAGDGGDELFAGNARYVYLRRFDVYGRIPGPVRKALADPLLSVPGVEYLPLGRRARNLKQHYYMSMPERMFADYHPFQSYALDEVFTADWYAAVREHDPVDLAQTAFDRSARGDLVQRMMGLDLQLTIADNDLVKVNGMCRLAGVDVRYPMLDDEVLEFSAGIPGDVLMPGGRLRGFYKEAMSGFLPEAIINKRKQGFGLPFKLWVGEYGPLRDCVLDALSDMRGRGILTGTYIDALERACRTPGNETMRGNAWDVAMLEYWLQHHPVSI